MRAHAYPILLLAFVFVACAKEKNEPTKAAVQSVEVLTLNDQKEEELTVWGAQSGVNPEGSGLYLTDLDREKKSPVAYVSVAFDPTQKTAHFRPTLNENKQDGTEGGLVRYSEKGSLESVDLKQAEAALSQVGVRDANLRFREGSDFRDMVPGSIWILVVEKRRSAESALERSVLAIQLGEGFEIGRRAKVKLKYKVLEHRELK